MAVLNIVHPQVDSWEWGQTAPQCWKRQVKVVAYMPYFTGESNGNYSPLAVDLYDSTQVPGKPCAIIPPANPTNTRVVMDSDTESVNEDVTTGTADSAASRYGLMAPGHFPPVHVLWRTCSVKHRKKRKNGVIM